MKKYDFLVKKLDEVATSWAPYGTEEGSMYDCMKQLHDFYEARPLAMCTHEEESKLFEHLADTAESDEAMEFIEDVEKYYKDMELHNAILVVLPDYFVE